jgi:hypothetical protein
MIQTTVLVSYPDYTQPLWQVTIFILVAITVSFIGNVAFHRALPHWQNAAFVLHVLAYFAILIPIWVNAPMASSEQVWTGFENSGGWSSMGLAVMIGQLPGATFQVGIDTVRETRVEHECQTE